jgi:DNA-binding NtrC family response regulator
MNDAPAVLVVDDERNIRLTLSMALEALNIPVDTAENGEEALQKLAEKSFQLMLLDLKLPDIDGLEVLRQVVDKHSATKVIIITAYGSVEVAVEAMKLGAIDFLQKPFQPTEVRDMVRRLLQAPPEDEPPRNYDYYVNLAKQSVKAGEFEVARVYAKKAIFIKYNRPEAYNILGGIYEVKGDRQEARNNYQLALDMDPSYEPAKQNLTKAQSPPSIPTSIVWD